MSKKNRNKGQGGGQNNSTDQVQNVHDVDLDKSRYSGDNRLSTNEGSTIADSANLEGKKYDSDDMGSSKREYVKESEKVIGGQTTGRSAETARAGSGLTDDFENARTVNTRYDLENKSFTAHEDNVTNSTHYQTTKHEDNRESHLRRLRQALRMLQEEVSHLEGKSVATVI